MKKLVALLLFSCLISPGVYCQLLSKPPLSVEDFETGLSNADHIKKILEKHNFKYSVSGKTRLTAPETMPNPLIPDLIALRSEEWEPEDQRDKVIVKISLYEWEPENAPLPEVIKTIRVILRRNPEYGDKTREFLEEIKNKYPESSTRYFRNNELYKSYGESFKVFTNGSKYEVRTETEKPVYSRFFIVNFDLIR